MSQKAVILLLYIGFLVTIEVECQVDLKDHFASCHKTDPTFDNCLRDALNDLRPYYKAGLPEYGISSLDPFYAEEIPQKRSNPFFNYRLVLRNVTEAGWTVSQITNFKTNLDKKSIQYTQFFPDKRLNGWYEIDGTFFGNKVMNKGSWTLNLFDFVQTTTITRKSASDGYGQANIKPQLKVKVNIQTCKKLELHIGHLAGGRTIVENMLDWVINNAWQPGFIVLSPLINDLVSTAFTEIFNKSFQNFPFEEMFQN